MYKKYNSLVREGDYWRIASYAENHQWDAWMNVSKDKNKALLTIVHVLNHPNFKSRNVSIKGLCPEKRYHITMENSFGEQSDLGTWSGTTLLNAGLQVPRMWSDFHSQLILFTAE